MEILDGVRDAFSRPCISSYKIVPEMKDDRDIITSGMLNNAEFAAKLTKK